MKNHKYNHGFRSKSNFWLVKYVAYFMLSVAAFYLLTKRHDAVRLTFFCFSTLSVILGLKSFE